MMSSHIKFGLVWFIQKPTPTMALQNFPLVNYISFTHKKGNKHHIFPPPWGLGSTGPWRETDVYLEPEVFFFFWHFSVPYPGIHHDERSLVFKPAFKNHNKHSISWNRKKPHEIAETAFKPLLSCKFKGTSPPNAKCPQGNTALNEPSLSSNSPVIRPAIYLGISVALVGWGSLGFP